MTEKRPRAYVCGPMAGKPGLNADQFERARWLVEQRGHEAVVPHNLSPYTHDGPCGVVYGPGGGAEAEHDGGCYLRGDLAVMVMCEYVFRLPGWERSKGACIESGIAVTLAIPIVDADADALAAAPIGVGQG